mmetsp:Transcript_19800/g.17505  ORF Transcript_19800/g.17505 Transcript_19800/m.17505 type:complete len:121 (+) Transcript_19800:485-847(+)
MERNKSAPNFEIKENKVENKTEAISSINADIRTEDNTYSTEKKYSTEKRYRMREKVEQIYEIKYVRTTSNKNYDEFIQEINSKQKKRKNDRKIKRNRNEVSMKEYIDDYFMRQLGYSLLR